MLRKSIKKFKQKQKDKMFSEYPCVCYLHNALHFISTNNLDVAYTEICHALLTSGEKLSDYEREKFNSIREKNNDLAQKG